MYIAPTPIKEPAHLQLRDLGLGSTFEVLDWLLDLPPPCMLTRVCCRSCLVLSTTCCLSMSLSAILIAVQSHGEELTFLFLPPPCEHALSENCTLQNAPLYKMHLCTECISLKKLHHQFFQNAPLLFTAN